MPDRRRSFRGRLDRAAIQTAPVRFDLPDPIAGAWRLSVQSPVHLVERDGEMWLEWPVPRTMGFSPPDKPGSAVLDEFIRLGDPSVSDERIRRFAEDWGQLRFCTHAKINGQHGDGRTCPDRSTMLELVQMADGSSANIEREPVSWWRAYAANMRGILSVAADVFSPNPREGTERDWSAIKAVPGDPPEHWGPPGVHATHIGTQRHMLAECVNNWLRFGDLRPRLFQRAADVRPFLSVAYGTLPSALAWLLTAAITQSNIRRCPNCGQPFVPPEQPGRPPLYCEECRSSGEAELHVKRESARRKRRGGPN